MSVLIDTSYLVAFASVRDANHTIARLTSQALTGNRIVPAPVLPEMFYMLNSRVNYATAMRMFRLTRTSAFQIETLTPDDMARMDEIMAQYSGSQFDFVDVAIMALSERLKITAVKRVDRRDFSTFKPAHADYIELLP